MKTELYHFDKTSLCEDAEKKFLSTGRFNPDDKRDMEIFNDALRYSDRVSDKIDLRAAVGRMTKNEYMLCDNPAKAGIFTGTISNVPFERVENLYFFVMSAGGICAAPEDSMQDAVNADMWGNAYLGALSDRIYEKIRKEAKAGGNRLSPCFGPGYYGMPFSAAHFINDILHGESVGVCVKDNGMLMPAKSYSGVYVEYSGKEISFPSACNACTGAGAGCQFCSVKKKYGAAVDTGTTTVVVMLYDLDKKVQIGCEAFTNPQAEYGADVISRITYIGDSGCRLNEVRKCLIEGINTAVKHICSRTGISVQDVYEYVVAGNTTMSHITAGLSPAGLAVWPFRPAFTGSLAMTRENSGLDGNENMKVLILPNIAGHVGSDISAGAATVFTGSGDENHLFIDIGTNGEIVLSAGGKIRACSVAAGPAFEGCGISCGMRASRGAVEKVLIDKSDVRVRVIGNTEPCGICGSGITDAAACMLRRGIIDGSGRILGREELINKGIPEKIAERSEEKDGKMQFVLYRSGSRNIFLTQEDVRKLQLAKSAVAAGVKTLMHYAGIKNAELEKISIAGAFGSCIDIDSAVYIGLIPDIPEERIHVLGNAAGLGAAKALISDEFRDRIEKLCGKIRHVELSSNPVFAGEYINQLNFFTKMV